VEEVENGMSICQCFHLVTPSPHPPILHPPNSQLPTSQLPYLPGLLNLVVLRVGLIPLLGQFLQLVLRHLPETLLRQENLTFEPFPPVLVLVDAVERVQETQE